MTHPFTVDRFAGDSPADHGSRTSTRAQDRAAWVRSLKNWPTACSAPSPSDASRPPCPLSPRRGAPTALPSPTSKPSAGSFVASRPGSKLGPTGRQRAPSAPASARSRARALGYRLCHRPGIRRLPEFLPRLPAACRRRVPSASLAPRPDGALEETRFSGATERRRRPEVLPTHQARREQLEALRRHRRSLSPLRRCRSRRGSSL